MTDVERRKELRKQIQLEKLAAQKDLPEKRKLAELAMRQLRKERRSGGVVGVAQSVVLSRSRSWSGGASPSVPPI